MACSPVEEQERDDAPEQIDCFIGKVNNVASVCEIERHIVSPGVLQMVVRHPDGGFRRFIFRSGDDIDFEVADGAQDARTRLADRGLPEIEVSIGDDLYKIPVELKKPND